MLTTLKNNATEINFENVSVNLDGNVILDDISVNIPKGSCTAIIGPNGAGKTTFIQSLLGAIDSTGNVTLINDDNSPVQIGYIPQKTNFDRGLPLTVLEFMVMGWQRIPLCFGVRDVYRQKAKEVLESVGLKGFESHRVGSLSGGEIQRLLLALSLAQNPSLLLLDEPATGMDVQGEFMLCHLLEKLRLEKGFTQLMVSHDLPTVAAHATHVICLNKKVHGAGHPSKVLTTEILTQTFGLHMGALTYENLVNNNALCSPFELVDSSIA